MNTIDSGDTAWILVSAALVMLMTPGLGFFYGGMVRQKNVLAMMGQSIIILSLISLQWALFGYSLSFGNGGGLNFLIGSFEWFALGGIGLEPNPTYSESIPHIAFVTFQCMFAVITPALIIGAFADRVKFITFILFTLLWATFVYDPICHWVWAEGGWLRELGSIDFAGGTVVHISAGASALAAAIIIGKRIGFKQENMPPHNVPFTILGGALLWFGWFGFNAGSSLGDESLATWAFFVTNLSASAAALAWIFCSAFTKVKPSVSGIIIGAVAGLVAITPAAGFVGVLPSILIGFVAGVLCNIAMSLRGSFNFDDSLDVLACHGVGGIWGAIATGLFANTKINPAGADGLFFGNPSLLWSQTVAVLAAIVYSFFATAIILYLLKFSFGLRVSKEEEIAGLDLSVHGEEAYIMLPVGEDKNALHILKAITVKEVMNNKVRTANLDDSLEKVQNLMLEKQHFAFPVLEEENKKLLGIITISDIRKISQPERSEVKVKSVYQKNPEICYPEENLHDLIQRMQDKQISNLPVVDSQNEMKLVGIISKTDLIKAYKNIVSKESF